MLLLRAVRSVKVSFIVFEWDDAVSPSTTPTVFFTRPFDSYLAIVNCGIAWK